jgi:bacillithiol biosynthesis cysteine-adding enzyme BshC
MNSIPLTSVYRSAILKTFINNREQLFPTSHGLSPKSRTTDKPSCVVTGQQVGLFGGPLYTLLKICSARAAADEILRSSGIVTDAVFWLEDNDHDAHEASAVWLPSQGTVREFSIWDGSNDRLPVCDRTLTEIELQRIDEMLTMIDGQFTKDVQQMLNDAYQSGTSWSDAFLRVITRFLDAWQIKVVRGSDVIASGSHRWLVEKDITEPGSIEALITSTTDELERQGFKAQAAVPDVLFFLKEDNNRQKLSLRDKQKLLLRDRQDFSQSEIRFTTNTGAYSTDDLLRILEVDPGRFSPSVLARPLVQDAHLNSVAAVLGPAEIGYHAQLVDVYKSLGLRQPKILCRHSACIVDAKTRRDLSKIGADPQFFFRAWDQVEHEIADTLAQETDLPEVEDETLSQILDPYRTAARQIDPTLLKTVEATGASIRSAVGHLESKLKSALKRSNVQTFERARTIWTSLFPEGSPNERILPLAMWMSRIGFDTLRIIVEKICEGSRNEFIIADTSQIETVERHAE